MPTENAGRQGAALNPITHFILVPIFLITFGTSINMAAHATEHRALAWWLVVVSFSLILLNINQRMYTLRVQDRVIRLEERLRYAELLSPELLARAQTLSLSQVIGLRFASDAELPALVETSLAESLTQKQIKEKILTWRADKVRV
jgi:Kef-type K+ transport system membrane component KefB